MYVIEYILKFPFSFSIVSGMGLLRFVGQSYFNFFKYKRRKTEDLEKMAVFTSKEHQVIKILRNGLGIVFLIFQRLI